MTFSASFKIITSLQNADYFKVSYRAKLITMVLTKFKKNRAKNEELKEQNNNPSILIVEDDIDQMNLLVDFTLSEIKKCLDDKNINDQQKQKIKNVRIITASNINSLQKAALVHKGIFLAVVDCNIPEIKGGLANDQFVKTSHRITGQHKAVDLVTEHLPTTAITMISSLNRFQKIVTQYYENNHGLSINFIRKNDALMIRKNIGYYLRQYLK